MRPSMTMLPLALAVLLAAGCTSATQEPTQAAGTPVASTDAMTSPSQADAPDSAAGDAAPAGADYRASGFSPAWSADVSGSEIALLLPDFAGPDVAPRRVPVVRSGEADQLRYEGKDGDTAFALELKREACIKATEGGAPRAFSATLRYGGTSYAGCADASGADTAAAGPKGKMSASDAAKGGQKNAIFRAFGTEPFWSVNVEGDRLHYTTPDDMAGKTFTGAREAAANDGVRISGEDGGTAFTLEIANGACSDGMSENEYTLVSTFTYGGKTYKGCAELAK